MLPRKFMAANKANVLAYSLIMQTNSTHGYRLIRLGTITLSNRNVVSFYMHCGLPTFASDQGSLSGNVGKSGHNIKRKCQGSENGPLVIWQSLDAFYRPVNHVDSVKNLYLVAPLNPDLGLRTFWLDKLLFIEKRPENTSSVKHYII